MDKKAAALLARLEAKEKAATPAKMIKMTCPFCDEEAQFETDLGGKQAPCPSCRRIIKVDKPKEEIQKDWRETNRVGPQHAKENIQQKLDGAWDTTRERVSRESLEEAGALPEPVAPPAGFGTWFRRGAIAAVVVVGLAGAWLLASNLRTEMRQQKALQLAVSEFKALQKDNVMQEDKMPRAWIAEYHRALGLIYLRKENPIDAKKNFLAARFSFPHHSEIAKGERALALDEQLYLIELALSQIKLGGDEQAEIDETRIGWEKVVKDLKRSLDGIVDMQAKLLGVRRVCLRLIKENQPALAFSLANEMNVARKVGDSASDLASQQVAQLLAMKSPKQAQALLPIPTGTEKNLELPRRLGYAEGKAHQRDYNAARKIALQKGVTLDRLRAMLAVAEVAWEMGDHAEAKTCLQAALKLPIDQIETPSLTVYRIAWLCGRLDSEKKAKTWASKIADPGCRDLARFEVLRQKKQEKSSAIDPAEFTNKKSLAYGLAVFWSARMQPAASFNAAGNYERRARPLIYIGAALGRSK